MTTTIVPISLEIENFMNHKDSFVDFTQFNSCLIVGKDINDYRKSNGTGKSTLFKLILGEEQPDGGEIAYPKGYKIGALKQYFDFWPYL